GALGDKAAEPTYSGPPAPAPAAAAAEQVDPLQEANIFITYGREAQAAQLLEDAVAENPSRDDIWLKLFEVQAARKDKNAFGRHARGFHELTGGKGESWLKVAAMGFALDPANPLYETGRGKVESIVPETAEVSSDFDFDREAPAPAADHKFPSHDTIVEPVGTKAPADAESGSTLDIEMVAPPAGETTTDISFDVPDADTSSTDLVLDAEDEATKSADGSPAIDFNIELPKADESPEERAKAAPAEGETKDTDSERKFALDLSGINLELDNGQKTESAPGTDEKDPHWHDVQEKFELVKAYQILGAEQASVLEILQDIVKEGDAQQRTEAKKLIDRLSSNNK
ncbi:MAG: hypothetical protein OEZ08_18305, partial [Betaproteobacteria bacterium]|nr:hypothetical protein [Betaproteobacteria bacterium]